MIHSTKKFVAKVGVAAMGLLLPLSVLAATNPFDTSVQKQFLGTVQEQSGLQQGDLPTIVGRIINIALSFLGIVLLFYLLWGGFDWMTAGGESKKVDDAKTKIRNAIIGLVIIVSAYAISNFVVSRLATLAG